MLVGWLRTEGYDCHRRNAGCVVRSYKGRTRRIRFSTPGECDWWLILKNGRHVDLEVKRPGAKPSIHQIVWMLRLNARGASAFWCDDRRILESTIGHLENGCHIYMNRDGSFDLCCARDVAEDRARRVLVEMAYSKEYKSLRKKTFFREALEGQGP